jgi:hypothetical protein
MSGWDTGRPIYHRLPSDAEQYQGNPVVDAITTPYDEILMQYKAALDSFEANFLNPDTARSDALDWLAQLCGFTGEYWMTEWADTAKRKLIKNSHLFIWRNKGTERLLVWLLNDVFELGAQVYQIGSFRADISAAGDDVGGDGLEYYILMQFRYETTSKEWRLAESLNRLYMPVFTDSNVVYDGFYADMSRAGDPVF